MNLETLNMGAVIVDQARAKYYLDSVYKLLCKNLKGVWAIYELLPAFIVSSIFIVIVSLATPKPSAEIEAEFEKQYNEWLKTKK